VATETLHFENARAAQQLFNHEPRNLQSLETELGVKATAREGWIKLEGEADAIERAKTCSCRWKPCSRPARKSATGNLRTR
jgi:phosphate starvation-inducible protein PhoH